MKGKSLLTEKEYEMMSQRLDILANVIAGSKEKELKQTTELKQITQEAIQYLRRLT